MRARLISPTGGTPRFPTLSEVSKQRSVSVKVSIATSARVSPTSRRRSHHAANERCLARFAMCSCSRSRPRLHRHQALARRFVGDPCVSCNLVFDDLNNELWWFLEEKLYFISSNSKTFVLQVRVFVLRQYSDIVAPIRSFCPTVMELLTAAALEDGVKKMDNFKQKQSEAILGTTAFKEGGLWEWKAKRAVPITAGNAGFTQPIQRAMPNMEDLDSFEPSFIVSYFLETILPLNHERYSLLSDLALAAAGRSDRLNAILLFIGSPKTGKSTLMEWTAATFGDSVGKFDISEALAYGGHGMPAARQVWKKALEFKNIALCHEPAQHGSLKQEGPMTFAGQAIKNMCLRVKCHMVTVVQAPPPLSVACTCAHLQPHAIPARRRRLWFICSPTGCRERLVGSPPTTASLRRVPPALRSCRQPP